MREGGSLYSICDVLKVSKWKFCKMGKNKTKGKKKELFIFNENWFGVYKGIWHTFNKPSSSTL